MSQQQAKTEEKTARTQDPELRILNHAIRLLDSISNPARERIVRYLVHRYLPADKPAVPPA